MGNRAVLCYSRAPSSTGIYIHWNGGHESIAAFLHVCRERGYRSPDADPAYGMARLCGLLCEFFGGGDSVGIGPLRELDVSNFDNGAYLIGENWSVVGRFGRGSYPWPASFSPSEEKKRDEIIAHLTKGD